MRLRTDCFRGKLIGKLAQLFYFFARKLWEIIIVCNYCGRDCGFDSCVSKFGFTCWDCKNRLFKGEK